VKRREFIAALAGAAAMPLIARAQASTYRLGILVVGAHADVSPLIKELQEGLRRLGYVEGQNVTFELRSAEGLPAKLPALANDLVGLKVDLIVAFQTPAITAAKDATIDIPIVMGASGDPVGTGLIESLARPGGNITGMSGISGELGAKNLELVQEVLPAVRRVAALASMPDPFGQRFLENIQFAGRTLGIEIKPVIVSDIGQLDTAFPEMEREGVSAAIVQPSLPHSPIIKLALKHRLPTFAPNAAFTISGGLIAYSADQLALAREAAVFVDKIFKGRKPAELPVQIATKFILTVNLKTAKAIGVTISPTLLARADEVIE
jgi:putative ABC transport system substrate-binding protein